MKEDDLHIDIIPVLVQKVLQEVGDALQCDVCISSLQEPCPGGLIGNLAKTRVCVSVCVSVSVSV